MHKAERTEPRDLQWLYGEERAQLRELEATRARIRALEAQESHRLGYRVILRGPQLMEAMSRG